MQPTGVKGRPAEEGEGLTLALSPGSNGPTDSLLLHHTRVLHIWGIYSTLPPPDISKYGREAAVYQEAAVLGWSGHEKGSAGRFFLQTNLLREEGGKARGRGQLWSLFPGCFCPLGNKLLLLLCAVSYSQNECVSVNASVCECLFLCLFPAANGPDLESHGKVLC